MFGVGINSDAGLVGSIVLDEQNFDWTRFPTSWEDIRNGTAWRGAGQRFRIGGRAGHCHHARHPTVQRYSVTFEEPYVFDTQVQPGAERILLQPHLQRIYRAAAWRPDEPWIPVHPRPFGHHRLPWREDQDHQSDRSVLAGFGRGRPAATWPCTGSRCR